MHVSAWYGRGRRPASHARPCDPGEALRHEKQVVGAIIRDTRSVGHALRDTSAIGSSNAFSIQEDNHLLTVIRFVERNALRAGLVNRAEDWP